MFFICFICLYVFLFVFIYGFICVYICFNVFLSEHHRKSKIQNNSKNKKPRQIHQNSLNNLQKAEAWTAETKPIKPRQISDEMIARADAMKADGMSWRQIGDKLLINFSSIRSAINRRNKLLQKEVSCEGHLSEKEQLSLGKNIPLNDL